MNHEEFVEKIMGSHLLQWQKELLMQLEGTQVPLYVCLPAHNGRAQAIHACKELLEILYGEDIKKEKINVNN